MQTQAYLNFNGRCEEALEFYRQAVDAEVLSLMRMKDSPDQSMISPGIGNKVMHASVRIGGDTLLASDGQCQGGHSEFRGVSLALTLDTPAEAERRFKALAEQGQVQMPLTQTFFAPAFGMLADRFGVTWMVLAKA